MPIARLMSPSWLTTTSPPWKLRFPAQLCSDGGRAINVPEPSWPATLRGEAAEIFVRWQRDLKPGGFHVVARVLDFPDGIPGDIGLFLLWG
jgi:hypothetical protein